MNMENKIKQLRTAQGWSQEELGKRLGVSRQAINAIERGKHDPSLQLAFAVAHIFSATLEEIFQPETLSIEQT